MTIQTSLSQEALFVAITQVGVREEKSNKGPEVARYLKAVGLPVGYAWCMAFVYWCTEMAANKLQQPNPLIKTAGVLDQLNRTTLRILPPRSSGIKPGDVFIMDLGKGLGHTGFIEKVNVGTFSTIEGNTNAAGSREGIEVARRTRSITEIRAIIQLP